jgi:hypothetical protein
MMDVRQAGQAHVAFWGNGRACDQMPACAEARRTARESAWNSACGSTQATAVKGVRCARVADAMTTLAWNVHIHYAPA